MLSESLFQEVLISPAREMGADRLLVVSGYATASMVDHHMHELKKSDASASIDLIVGMAVSQGISAAHHSQFVKLSRADEAYGCTFTCRYVVRNPPVHAKVYIWLKGGDPVQAFAGSANYTLTGFGDSQTEYVSEIDPCAGLRFWRKVHESTAECSGAAVTGRIKLKDQYAERAQPRLVARDLRQPTVLSLLARGGETGDRSGINWGQRPGRDPNQAYIPVSVEHYEYFPPLRVRFAVTTDDGQGMIMVREQEKGKALCTPEDNAQLGRYLRQRIGVPSGERVTRSDLERYGRTDITFAKIDYETYYLDFSVP